ncbi:EpsG family protein [Photobacterium phosphoreum]|uniref:EpsG family protein n=1 Tax=Photobacterium phosphoreum TaxID=659 RepID=UPI001E337FAD|nr:EpsG family protein [Photobacterium phosphoreum]MCD9511826.1 hypothetical protein [Photobacterium phosphoreum]
MSVYDILVLVLLFSVVFSCVNTKVNSIMTMFCLIFVYFVVSFRGIDVDRDAFVYQKVFIDLSSISFSEISAFSSSMGQEIGFIFLMKIFNIIGFDFFGFRLFYNLLCLLSLTYLLFKYIPNKFRLISYLIYVAMFLLFRDFTQIRFCLACLLSMIAILKSFEGNYKQGIIITFVAILFHNTALITIPVIIFISIFKDNKIYTTVFAVFLLIVCFIISKVDLIGYIISMPFMPHQLTRYVDTEDLSSSSYFGIGFFVSSAICLILSFDSKEIYKNVSYKFLYLIMLFSACASILFHHTPILMRMQLLLFTGIIFFPSIFYNIYLPKKAYVNYVYQISLTIIFILYFYKNLSSGIVYQYGVY